MLVTITCGRITAILQKLQKNQHHALQYVLGMRETRGSHHCLSCPPRFTVEQRDGATQEGVRAMDCCQCKGRLSQGLDLRRKGSLETWDGEGIERPRLKEEACWGRYNLSVSGGVHLGTEGLVSQDGGIVRRKMSFLFQSSAFQFYSSSWKPSR